MNQVRVHQQSEKPDYDRDIVSFMRPSAFACQLNHSIDEIVD